MEKAAASKGEVLDRWYKQNKPDLDKAFKDAKIPQWQLLNFGDKLQIYNFIYKLDEYSIETQKVTLH